MKFCKKYEEYMQGLGQKKLPGVGFKNLKKILKRCKEQSLISPRVVLDDDLTSTCQVCGEIFFSTLTEESCAVLKFFNERAERLLEQHLGSGCSNCCILFKDKLRGDNVPMVEQGRDLVTYAIINAVAMRKILKKFNKICNPEKGQALKSQVQNIYIKILQSPWLFELMALQMNIRESGANAAGEAPALFKNSLVLNDNEKPSLSCEIFDSIKIDIDLTCSICLEILFDPVSLSCGHIFCNICACKAASVTIVDGLKAANSTQNCPICREGGVYEAAVQLEEVHILISRSFPEYWKERRKSEKAERMQQVKEYWDSQARLFIGASWA